MGKPYRIGIDARLWSETGVGRYIRNLVLQLQEIDKYNEYVLFVLSKDREQIKGQVTNPKFHIKTADIRWHSISEQRQLPKNIDDEHIDLMHFPYFSVPVLYKRPFVVTIHDVILHHFPTGKATTLPLPIYMLKQVAYRFVVAQAARKARKILTVSHATALEIQKDLHIPNEKIVVTYEGVDLHVASKKKEKDMIGNPYFLYVGNAYPHKNLERLLHAFALFKATDAAQTKLVFVGKEDYFYTRLQKEVKNLQLEQSVIFKHEVSDTELVGLYQHALSLVVPSLMEGFGLPGLEAMQNSCLVVASAIPSLQEIYQDAAVYVDPYSVEAIAKTLKTVYGMKHQDRTVYLHKGDKRVKDFSWKSMAAQTLALYESCLSL